MRASLHPAVLERFRGLIEGRIGLRFDAAKLGPLEEVLEKRMKATGLLEQAYLGQLEAEGTMLQELNALAEELTVGETYFFRHMDQFRALAETVLPDRMRARAPQRMLRILSAGCASGEEAYSLAIVCLERLGDLTGWDFEIRAVDINTASLERATRARYSAWSLREVPRDLQSRWLAAHGSEFVPDGSARALVKFEKRNLVEEDRALWPEQYYDVVFCRNVLMYFAPEHARALVGRIARALAPGGYLFLGHAETLRALSQDFHLWHTHNTFYYQVKAGRQALRPLPWTPAQMPAAPPLLDIVESADSWVEAIQSATERIRALTQAPTRGSAPPRSSPARGEADAKDLGRAVELLQDERYGDALELVDTLPPGPANGPEVLLLRAVLLTHSGSLPEAEEACHKLLLVDELNAGAHYLLALCSEGLGDRKRAQDHDQVAVYLDPTFAMPRLHLGLLARRARDRDASRREFGQALQLLQFEDPARLLLFGGGFSRDALVALCRAELAACGGQP